MEPSALLLVGTEVSIAFAGFSGIIATFQLRSGEKLDRGDVVGITIIVQISLVTALFCVLPMVCLIAGIDEEKIWGFFSGAGAIWSGANMYFIHKKMLGRVRNTTTRWLFGLLQMICGVLTVCLTLNALNLVFHRAPAPFLAALIFGLALVGIMFSRLLLRPLWRMIREQET